VVINTNGRRRYNRTAAIGEAYDGLLQERQEKPIPGRRRLGDDLLFYSTLMRALKLELAKVQFDVLFGYGTP